MLNPLAKFEEIKLKLIIGSILFCLIAGAVYAWRLKIIEVDELKETITKNNVEIKSLKDTADKKEAADKITENTNLKVANKLESVSVDSYKRARNAELKIDKITHDFDAKLANASGDQEKDTLQEEKDNETSLVMITTLWDEYCAELPNTKECSNPTSNDKTTSEG